MEREAIKKAHEAYLLEQEAKKDLKPKLLEEKEVLRILRTLEGFYPNHGISISEILYVGMKVFWKGYSEVYCHHVLCEKLWRLAHDGKVIYTHERRWKLASEKEVKE